MHVCLYLCAHSYVSAHERGGCQPPQNWSHRCGSWELSSGPFVSTRASLQPWILPFLFTTVSWWYLAGSVFVMVYTDKGVPWRFVESWAAFLNSRCSWSSWSLLWCNKCKLYFSGTIGPLLEITNYSDFPKLQLQPLGIRIRRSWEISIFSLLVDLNPPLTPEMKALLGIFVLRPR